MTGPDRPPGSSWPHHPPDAVRTSPGSPGVAVALLLASAAGAALPLFVPTAATGLLGLLCALVLLLGTLAVVGGAGTFGLDGWVVSLRSVRGTRTLDLRQLTAVDGSQVRSRDGDLDMLVLHEQDGPGLSLVFPVRLTGRAPSSLFLGSRPASAATRDAVHGRVRDLVGRGQVPVVTETACAVLRLPREAARPGHVPRRRGAVLGAVVALLVVVAVLLGYVQLLSTVGLAEPL